MVQAGSIAIYGATGYTGRAIAAELARRGLTTVLVARNRRGLEELARSLDAPSSTRTASVDDPDAMRAAFAGCSVVVNAAGPFSTTGRAVVEAALDAGCHYVDICADGFVMKTFFDEYDARAQAANKVVVPGVSFYFVLSDLLAHVLAEDQGKLTSISVGYALERWSFTPGSMAAFWDMVGRRLERTGGTLSTVIAGNRAAPDFTFGAQNRRRPMLVYPGGEVVTLPRHIDVDDVRVWMTARTFAPRWAVRALPAVMALVGVLSRSWLGPRLRRAALRLPARDLEAGRAAARFTVEVHAQASGRISKAWVVGRHMYGIGAWLTADAAAKIAAGEVSRRGVLAPAQAFEPRSYLEALRAHELIDVVSIPPDAGAD